MRIFLKQNSRRGFTMVEVMIAGGISAALGMGMISLTVMAQRIMKGNFSQQMAITNAKGAIDGLFGLNRQFGMALSSGASAPQVFDKAGKVTTVGWGNRVDFSWPTDAAGKRRRFELRPGPDGDMFTPWDNVFVYVPDTSKNGNEIVVATGISPLNSDGAFRFRDATTPLTVQMRAGDPMLRPGDAKTISQSQRDNSDAHTGKGFQGVEINITVAARN